jgi:hypothetical protein
LSAKRLLAHRPFTHKLRKPGLQLFALLSLAPGPALLQKLQCPTAALATIVFCAFGRSFFADGGSKRLCSTNASLARSNLCAIGIEQDRSATDSFEPLPDHKGGPLRERFGALRFLNCNILPFALLV